QWYPVPAGVDAVGGNYFLPGSESLKTKLGDPWPACKFTGYNPNTITAAQLYVDGVPCVLVAPKPPEPAPTPSPSGLPIGVPPGICPPGWIQNDKCILPFPSPPAH
ncbi:MAG TPA: hypothetical protein VET65_12625, partial [Candidatus Limnocylindrales bacterium]|nr:hypothetical protein [Candidatus Limnocylindrales bacterium]